MYAEIGVNYISIVDTQKKLYANVSDPFVSYGFCQCLRLLKVGGKLLLAIWGALKLCSCAKSGSEKHSFVYVSTINLSRTLTFTKTRESVLCRLYKIIQNCEFHWSTLLSSRTQCEIYQFERNANLNIYSESDNIVMSMDSPAVTASHCVSECMRCVNSLLHLNKYVIPLSLRNNIERFENSIMRHWQINKQFSALTDMALFVSD